MVPLSVEEAREAGQRIEGFLAGELTDPASGAIYVNAAGDRPVIAGEARNRDSLSEAAGQMMELALLRGERAVFERQFKLVKEKFLDEQSGFLAWKISLDPFRRADTSATLDDWRVAWACAAAGVKWDWDEVLDFGRRLGEKLIAGSRGFRVTPPAFNLGDGSPGGGPVLLCYLHLPAMRLLGPDGEGGMTLFEQARAVVERLPGPPGMVPRSWDPATGDYSRGPSDEVLALLTLLHLQAVEPESDVVREAIEVRRTLFREQGQLPQAFQPQTAAPLAEPGGASVYALFARLLLADGKPDEAALSLRKMLEFQNPPAADYPGAIGRYPVFSFDQLEALLALEAFLRHAG